MRHEQKCEESAEDSGDRTEDEDEGLEKIVKEKLSEKLIETETAMVKEQDYAVDNQNYVLNETRKLSKKQKLAFYKDPDYCFLVDKKYMPYMREALEPLLKAGGIYYTTHDP